MTINQKKTQYKAKVLVAEDDQTIASTIEYNLQREGYEVHLVDDGDNVLSYAKLIIPDVILMDWVLPGQTGPVICKTLRAEEITANVPIIMISSKGEELDKVIGLEHGADDYITKPVSPIELNARIKAILRRIRPAFVEKKLNYLDVTIDLDSCSVERNGHAIKLSPIEYQILQVLIEHPKRVFSRESLIERIWGDDSEIDERTVDVHITRLRKHLMNFGPDLIQTVRMVGYKIE